MEILDLIYYVNLVANFVFIYLLYRFIVGFSGDIGFVKRTLIFVATLFFVLIFDAIFAPSIIIKYTMLAIARFAQTWWNHKLLVTGIVILITVVSVWGYGQFSATTAGKSFLSDINSRAVEFSTLSPKLYSTNIPTPSPTLDSRVSVTLDLGNESYAEIYNKVGTTIGRVYDNECIAIIEENDDFLVIEHLDRGWTGRIYKEEFEGYESKGCSQ